MLSTLRAVLRRAGFGQAVRVLHYGLIVATAWAAATVVIKVVGLDLHPKLAPPRTSDEASARAAKGKRGNEDAVILKRNLFGATDLDVATDDAPAAASTDLRLRGIAASNGASFAVFENLASGEQNVFGIGDKVFDGPKLVSIDPAGADVLQKGKKRRYEIEEDDAGGNGEARHGGPNAKGQKTDKGADRNAKTGKKDGAAASGVKKTGEGAYLVDRREVEHTVANLNEVITQARAVPVLADGKGAGFKLFNIKPGSIFEKIGLEDGDIVQRVNDTELSDPSKAVGLLEEIQSMSQIKVNFTRSGKTRSYTYTIR